MGTQEPPEADGESSKADQPEGMSPQPGEPPRLEVPGVEHPKLGVPPMIEEHERIAVPKPGEPTARFDDDVKQKPQRYLLGRAQQLPPTRPPDPIRPYMPPRVTRRRRSDWPVLIFALVVAGLVMVGCCLAGFALYSGYGGPFAR